MLLLILASSPPAICSSRYFLLDPNWDGKPASDPGTEHKSTNLLHLPCSRMAVAKHCLQFDRENVDESYVSGERKQH